MSCFVSHFLHIGILLTSMFYLEPKNGFISFHSTFKGYVELSSELIAASVERVSSTPSNESYIEVDSTSNFSLVSKSSLKSLLEFFSVSISTITFGNSLEIFLLLETVSYNQLLLLQPNTMHLALNRAGDAIHFPLCRIGSSFPFNP